MLIDTHCHLNFPQFDPDRAMVVGNAKKAGVKKFINPGVDLFFSKQAVLLAQKNPGIIYAGIGFHPYEAQHDPDMKALEALLHSNPSLISSSSSPATILAGGGWGLQYHPDKGKQA